MVDVDLLDKRELVIRVVFSIYSMQRGKGCKPWCGTKVK